MFFWRLYWPLPGLLFAIPVCRWEASPWSVLSDTAYRTKSCRAFHWSLLRYEHLLLWMESGSPLTMTLLSVCSTCSWFHINAFVRRVSAYRFDVILTAAFRSVFASSFWRWRLLLRNYWEDHLGLISRRTACPATTTRTCCSWGADVMPRGRPWTWNEVLYTPHRVALVNFILITRLFISCEKV